MQREIFCGNTVIDGDERILLEYFIIPKYIHEEYCNLWQYGVKVKKTVMKNGGTNIAETKEISNIFYDESEAKRFVQLIMKNRVTPVTLMDVVEDYIISAV